MIRILPEHLQAFAQSDRREFERRLAAFLRNEFPVDLAGVRREVVAEMVHRIVQRALDYQLTSERDVASYAELCLLLGEGFEQRREWGWAEALLRDPQIEGAERLARIRKRLGTEP